MSGAVSGTCKRHMLLHVHTPCGCTPRPCYISSLLRTATAADIILEALQAVSPEGKTAVRVNKTALRSMRVDGLRELLEQLDSDSRGSKEALVQRLMQLNDEEQQQQGEQQQAAVSRAAAAVKEG